MPCFGLTKLICEASMCDLTWGHATRACISSMINSSIVASSALEALVPGSTTDSFPGRSVLTNSHI